MYSLPKAVLRFLGNLGQQMEISPVLHAAYLLQNLCKLMRLCFINMYCPIQINKEVKIRKHLQFLTLNSDKTSPLESNN